MLHLSALPVWPLEGKGGMPSLRETLHGHLRGGHSVVLVLPKYELFEDQPKMVKVPADEGYEVHLAACRWVPALLAARRMARRLGGGKEPPYLLRWILNLNLCMLLTGSLLRVVLRLCWRQKKRFDLVYAHNEYTALAGWITARALRIPNVTRLYGTFLAGLMKRPLVSLRYPMAAAGYRVPHSLLICANDGTRGDEVAKRMGIDLSKFRFWQNGVDMPDKPPSSSRSDLVAKTPTTDLRAEANWVLSCSRLSYWKRIDRMIRALQGARELGCDCQLLVAGGGAEEQRLRSLSVELGVKKDVVWLGAVDHNGIWELMHVADVFMITNDVTNRCNPLYEAICANLPVISVRDTSTADLLGHEDNALLAEKGDVDVLAENLARVCHDQALATAMRHAQQQRAEGLWSWSERMAVECRELESLLNIPAVSKV